MINWNAFVQQSKPEENPANLSKSRDIPTNSRSFLESRDNSKPNIDKGSSDKSRPSRLIPTQKEDSRLCHENNPPGEGGASDNYCATEMYPVNPIAVTLLLTCCNKAPISKEETLEAIWKLQTMPQPEQIRSWAILCQKYGIDPHRVIYPFTQSPNKGTSCQGCKHIEMQKIPIGKRPVYRFVCNKQHQILETYYVAERILIAPESCRDYQPTAYTQGEGQNQFSHYQ